MKRKILVFFVIILSLFIIACGKSTEGTGKIVEINKEEENMEKYNVYIDLHNKLVDSNPILEFDEEYSKLFYDEQGNYRKAFEKGYVETFAMNYSMKFFQLDNVLKAVNEYVDKKPKYDFDENVRAIIKLSTETKNKIIEMIDYYSKKFYLDDDYAKGAKYHEEFNILLNKLEEEILPFITAMEALDKETVLEQLKQYEKDGSIAQLNMQKFNIEMNNFLDILYNREELKFAIEDINKLKEINSRLNEIQGELEKIDNKQLEKEGVPVESFKNNFIQKTKDLVSYSSSIITRIEKGQSEDEILARLEDYEKAYSRVIESYNSMIE